MIPTLGRRQSPLSEAALRAAAERDGRREAERQIAPPGFSEHHLGTALDFGIGAPVGVDFARTPQAAWLAARAAEFGFALSYPPGSESVTGMVAEPWHYRYVGREHATNAKAAGIALETYLEKLPGASRP